MKAATCEAPVAEGRTFSEKNSQHAKPAKLRVLQVGSYPIPNRGAKSNLFTIHERLQARGHDSVVVDLTPYNRVKNPNVFYPRTTLELLRLLNEVPADVVHLQIGSTLNWRKLALAAMVLRLKKAKKICTLHLGGRFYPKRGLRAASWGVTASILRQFDRLIAINPEIASFFSRIGVGAERMQLITPFPRLRTAESVSLSDDIEHFCRQHTPLLVSVGEFEPGYDLPKQFDVLNKVRERYPSAGLIAIGSGHLHFKFMYERTLHHDSNHIELTGTLSDASISELIQRANVVLHPDPEQADSFVIEEARKARTPVVGTNEGPRRSAAYLTALGDIEIASLNVLRSLQIARPQYEDAPAALTDGVDDIIRLYKQLATMTEVAEPAQQTLEPAYEWPSIGWGL